MKADTIIAMLKREQGDLSLRQFSAVLGVSAPYLSDVYRGYREPGPTILKRYGLAKRRTTTVMYEKARK